ncbi:WD repeat-containing protein 85-like protein [Gorgonomyces haynaldii]|nr:WD repeat-containing protein 85-like protein [Gorgonomyces haynaldii]
MRMRQKDSLMRIDTIYSADAVEFCPVEGKQLLCAVGTYQVLEREQEQEPTKRTGRLLLYNASTGSLVQQIDCSAILDMKWHHSQLFVVTSVGDTVVYELEGDLVQKSVLKNGKDNILNLSIDLFGQEAVIGQSDGCVQVLNADMTMKQQWKAHDFEAWTSVFDKHNPYIYTGGDDCKLKRWDTRSSVCTLQKTFDCGVTIISSHPKLEHTLATGSYDDHLRIWDTRNMKQELSSFNTGGGVWRLKWHPRDPNIVLAACMYNGFHIFDIQDQITLKYSHMEHQSIAYGADWCLLDNIIGTCSFYDHLLTFWNFDVYNAFH